MRKTRSAVEAYLAGRAQKEGKSRFIERQTAFYAALSAGVMIAAFIINPESTITLPLPVTLTIIFVFALGGGYLAARREWRKLERITREAESHDNSREST